MVGFLDMLLRPGGGTVDQVMRDAKAPRLPGPSMHTLPLSEMLPAENIGEVGDLPPVRPGQPLARQLSGPFDEAAFAEPTPRLPSPMGATLPEYTSPLSSEDEQPLDGESTPLGASAQRQPSPGGGLPVQPSGAPVSEQGAATPRAVSPTQARLDEVKAQKAALRARKREIMLQGARVLMNGGGPISQVRASQLFFEIQKDVEAEQAEEQAALEQQLMREDIEASPADETDKARARALLRFGPKANDIQETLRFDASGAKDRLERREQFTKWRISSTAARREAGDVAVAADIAKELLDNHNMTTGTEGYLAGYIPGSAATRLKAVLDTFGAMTAIDKVQEMRAENKTGGALGNQSDTEGRWLMSYSGVWNPVNTTPDQMKDYIDSFVEGKKITAKMRGLIPAVEAGDPQAIAQYDELTEQLATNGARVRAKRKHDLREVPSATPDFDAKYGVQ